MISGGVRVVFNRLSAVAPEKAAAVRRVRTETALKIEADWKSDVRVDTGTYRRSIHTEEDGPDRTIVGSADAPGKALSNEYGNSRGMAPRPSATQAAERQRRPYADAVRKALAE